MEQSDDLRCFTTSSDPPFTDNNMDIISQMLTSSSPVDSSILMPAVDDVISAPTVPSDPSPPGAKDDETPSAHATVEHSPRLSQPSKNNKSSSSQRSVKSNSTPTKSASKSSSSSNSGSTPKSTSSPRSGSNSRSGSTPKSQANSAKGKDSNKSDLKLAKTTSPRNSKSSNKPSSNKMTTPKRVSPQDTCKKSGGSSSSNSSSDRKTSRTNKKPGKHNLYKECSSSSSSSSSCDSDSDEGIVDVVTVSSPDRQKRDAKSSSKVPKTCTLSPVMREKKALPIEQTVKTSTDILIDPMSGTSIDLKNIFEDVDRTHLLSPIPNSEPKVPVSLSPVTTASITASVSTSAASSLTSTTALTTTTSITIPGLSHRDGIPSIMVHIPLSFLPGQYKSRSVSPVMPLSSPMSSGSYDPQPDLPPLSDMTLSALPPLSDMTSSASTGFLPALYSNVTDEPSPGPPSIEMQGDPFGQQGDDEADIGGDINYDFEAERKLDVLKQEPMEVMLKEGAQNKDVKSPCVTDQSRSTAVTSESTPDVKDVKIITKETVQEKKPDQVLAEILIKHDNKKPPTSIKIPKRKKETGNHGSGDTKRPRTERDLTPKRDDYYEKG